MTDHGESRTMPPPGTAFTRMDAGFLLFDKDGRLVASNAPARALLAPVTGPIAPGLARAAVMRAISAGDRDAGDRGAALRRWEVALADGRALRFREGATDDGGTVVIVTDIGEAKARERRLMRLAEIGIALSAEKNLDRLLETILIEAKDITGADGGTVYLRLSDEIPPDAPGEARVDPRAGGDRRARRDGSPARDRRSGGDRRARGDRLAFAILRNDSLGLAQGGTTGNPVGFAPLPLYDPATGLPNRTNVATLAALTGETINIADAYADARFDFSGTRAFDARTGYRSTSFLTIPMTNKAGDVTGVLQLVNARDARTGAVVPFDPDQRKMIEALASQAAVALDNQMLLDGQRKLFDAFVQLIATAIDEKSPYTGGHCARVPVLTEMLADAACRAEEGPFRDFDLDDDERYELHIAAWLHDCGKVTTPEHLVDKATKLEGIVDRIELIRLRFEILRRDAEIAHRAALAAAPPEAHAALEAAHAARLAALDRDLDFIERINPGGETMSADDQARVRAIAEARWRDARGREQRLIGEDEARGLCVERGTLTPEERQIVLDHIVATIRMLDRLPFPKELRRVPEYAGGHHERMDGSGFPRGLTREQMSVPARMMAIADIFEALTAEDRPYKRAKSLGESMAIMARMRDNGHIDPDLFDLFVNSGVYRHYAERFLRPGQIDAVDHAAILARGTACDRVERNKTTAKADKAETTGKEP